MLGQHCVKTRSSTQAIISLSSGEAEYYGVVKASSTGLGCRALLADLGKKVTLTVHTDAEAAKGIASRMGLGKPGTSMCITFGSKNGSATAILPCEKCWVQRTQQTC